MGSYRDMVDRLGHECPTCEGVCCELADDSIELLTHLLRKFANHRADCGCFICRTLTSEERAQLAGLWACWGGRKK